MTKILLMSNGYPSKVHPHYLVFVQNIKNCLVAAGYEVDLLVMSSDFRTPLGKYLQYFKYYFKALFFNRYREYEYVYIHIYPYLFLPLIPHFHKMKNVVIHWHGIDIIHESLFARILNTLSYKFITKRFNHVAPSNYFANEVAKTIKINIKSISVSPSGGVDTSMFKEKSNSSKTTGLIRVGLASALLKAKGVDLVLQLLENVKQIEKQFECRIEFHFIEYGKEKKKYVELFSHFQNVVKHSSYPISRMVEFYHQIDILLFPSLTRGESLGLVALEAMACNIPVIATDAFAFKDTVLNGVSGERFTINDFSSFQNALLICIQNIHKYTPREFVLKHYSKQSVVEKYKLLFH